MAEFYLMMNSDINGSLLMKVKKYTRISFSEIKSNITEQQPIMVVNRRNKDEMEKMRDLVQVLSNHQVPFTILKQTEAGTEELTLEMFMNGFELSRQIAQEREGLDAILDDEEED
ncbi:hypothetical protein [Paenibacillus alvei]|uniref:hypothetical protein n=1 Tax=Paenibacillus alvei TaxID=44250 RepID=UPI00227DFC09|nr:hypothetical protein [Paenibacillus alvei]